MDFETAARRVSQGRSILFLGAGFSFEAYSQSGEALTDASGLANRLASLVGEEDGLPLDVVSDVFVEEHGFADLKNYLVNSFKVERFEEFHSHLAALPWRRIYTTNYDDLIEKSRAKAGKDVKIATLSDTPKDVLDSELIVHLNGYIDRLTVNHWDSDFILSESQYMTEKFRESPWAETFRTDIALADSVIFMGYSLYDFDIAKILFENPDVVKKTFFVIGEGGKRATELKVKNYGEAIKQNVSAVAGMFPAEGDPNAIATSAFPASLQLFSTDPAASTPSTDDVTRFLTKGVLDERFLVRSVVEGNSDYYVPRENIEGTLDLADQGPLRLLIHSRIGNGKTLSLLEIATLFRVAGFQAYFFDGTREGLKYDLEFLMSLPSEDVAKTIVFVEDGFSHSDVLRTFSENFPKLSLVTTARSAALETRLGSADEALGDEYLQFDLNSLSDSEIDEIDALLLAHGLWGEMQGWSQEKRKKFVQTRCRSQLSTVLLAVCKATHIFDNFGEALREAQKADPKVFETLLAALAMSYAGYNLRISQLCEIVQNDIFKLGRLQRNEFLREFLEFADNRVSIRSPVFAQAVLAELIPDHEIVEQIPHLISRLDRLSRGNNWYEVPTRKLMRFGFIEKIIGQERSAEKLVAFYEAVRSYGVGTTNPQFWLQFAIARLSFKDYVGAEKNFETAFGLVDDRRAYDPFQIENHFARFLLESRTETEHWDDYFGAISQAHEIIRGQMRRYNEGHYPYKVASNYLSFIEARNSELSEDELLFIADWCRELLAIADGAPVELKRAAYWREFGVIMRATIDLIDELVKS